MGFSGRIGAGGQAALEELFKRQMAEEELAATLQQQGIENQRADERLNLDYEEMAGRRQDRILQGEERQARIKTSEAALKRQEYEDLARKNMGELLPYPDQLNAFSMTSGVDVPAHIAKQQETRLLNEELQRVIDDPNTPPEVARALTVQKAGGRGVGPRDMETDEETFTRIGNETTAREQAQEPFEDSGAGTGGMGPNDARALNQVRQLTNEFERRAAPVASIVNQYATMQDGYRAALAGDMNAATDAVLYTFNKILDPNSVVREGEYLRSLGAMSLVQQAQAAVQRIQAGGRLTPDQMKQYLNLSRQIAERAVRGFEPQKARTVSQAEAYGLDPTLITRSIELPPDEFGLNNPTPQGPRTPTNPGTPTPAPAPGAPPGGAQAPPGFDYEAYKRRRQGGGQ